MFQLVKQRAKTRLPVVGGAAPAPTTISVVVCTVVVPKTYLAKPFLLFWLQFAAAELLLPELPVALLQTAPDRAMAQLGVADAASAFVLEPRGFVGVPEAGQGRYVYWVEARPAAAQATAIWQWMPPYCGGDDGSGSGVWALASEILNNAAVGPWPVQPSVVQLFQSLPQLALLERSKGSSSGSDKNEDDATTTTPFRKWYPLPDAMYAAVDASARELERCFLLGIQLEPERLLCAFSAGGEGEEKEDKDNGLWGRFAVWESTPAAQICLGIGKK